jgi:polyisoprenoid-binding protein YceI
MADGAWVLSGELTIGDVTRQVELEVEFLGVDPDGLQGETRIGFTVRGAVSRRDFGITFRPGRRRHQDHRQRHGRHHH